jgi:hypothetical protein
VNFCANVLKKIRAQAVRERFRARFFFDAGLPSRFRRFKFLLRGGFECLLQRAFFGLLESAAFFCQPARLILVKFRFYLAIRSHFNIVAGKVFNGNFLSVGFTGVGVFAARCDVLHQRIFLSGKITARRSAASAVIHRFQA